MTKITVVTICYNSVSDIRATIESVLKQDYTNVEFIVIDGASKDGTVDIIKEYENDIDYWVSEPDNGIFDAMNKGISRSSGDYIFFLNSGDTFVSFDVLSSIATVLNNNKDKNNVYCGGVLLEYNGNSLGQKYSKNIISSWYTPPHQATFYPSIALKESRYNDKYRYLGDRELLFNLRKVSKIALIPIHLVVAKYDLSGVSSKRKNAIKIFKEATIIAKLYGDYSFIVYFKQYLKAYTKYLSSFLLSDKLYFKLLYLNS